MGRRSARRAALRMLADPARLMLPLAEALDAAAAAVKPCSVCGNLDSADPCRVCTDPQRERGMVCVVEGVADLWALERAGAYRGLYHVLGGVLSPLAGVGPEQLSV
ncbi:MAG: toprim domain-containing protein, partial [Acetobacteraceae bacterium]